MKTPLNILHLEDNRLDATLIHRMLSTEGITANISRVDTRDAFLEALAQGGFDLILSDFTLPSFDGLTALQLASEKRADTPFIFVSGTLGEDVAIESLKRGASDYVLKHRLGRLGHAVQRAFREIKERHERHRIQEEIQKLNQQLEERVRERTAQLEATNKELESFTQTVSHDLRAPIRRILGNREMLEEDCGGQLSQDGRRYLQNIAEEGRQMNEIIHALLDLARIAGSQMECSDIDLSGMAESVLKRLAREEPARQVELVIMGGLSGHGDYPLLRIAFENLLGNAWKFTGKCNPARIEFGCQPQDERQVYYVRDNGAGFDMAYAAKLFTPLQRLHSKTDFPGTGIGLSTVQRIIHRHGGLIWAEAAKGQGATFYFTLWQAGASQG